jgi:hypothetical protein
VTVIESMEIEALEQEVSESGAVAVRVLRTAASAAAQRDAARAHVVLAFERDARKDHRRSAAAAWSLAVAAPPGGDERERLSLVLRTQGLIERSVDLAMRVADLGRLAARRGAPQPPELDQLCRVAITTCDAASDMLRAGPDQRRPLVADVGNLLLRCEALAAVSAAWLERGESSCLAF